jgi:hypothetical protein
MNAGVEIVLRRILIALGAALLATLVSACAYLNEGAINYRKATLKKEKYELLELAGKYSLPSSERDAVIRKNDTISIYLAQAYIKGLHEIPAYWKGETSKKMRGEVAIVVRAFELSDTNDLDFGPNAVDAGRLIYYSDDARENQFLNFSFLPIYGPITYRGNPVVLQIYMLELDADTDKLKPLLSTLAKAGTSAYPPAAPALSLIENLGSALLAGNHDDVMFRYSFTLLPDHGYAGSTYPVLEAGNYVLIRKANRQQNEDWDNFDFHGKPSLLRFDQSDGRLVVQPGGPVDKQTVGKGGEEKVKPEIYRDETYAVIAIHKNMDPTSLDLAQNTFKTFYKILKSETTMEIERLDLAAKNYLAEQNRVFEMEKIRKVKRELAHTPAQEKSKRLRLGREWVDSIITSIDIENECKQRQDNSSANCSGRLRADQLDYLISEIRRQIKDPALANEIQLDNVKSRKDEIVQSVSE